MIFNQFLLPSKYLFHLTVYVIPVEKLLLVSVIIWTYYEYTFNIPVYIFVLPWKKQNRTLIYYFFSSATEDESARGPICHFFLNSSVVSIESNYSYGDIIYNHNNTVQCNNPTDNCFNIWNSEKTTENGTTQNKIRMIYSGKTTYMVTYIKFPIHCV